MMKCVAGQFYERVYRQRLDRLFDQLVGAPFAATTWIVLTTLLFWFLWGVDALRQLWPYMTIAAVGSGSSSSTTASPTSGSELDGRSRGRF
jgi:hypothetical protein